MRELLPALDADDTIIMGSTPMYNLSYQKGLQAVGIHLDDREIRNATDPRWGTTHTHQLRHILGGDEERARIAGDVFMWHMENVFVEAIGFLPGTAEALGRLATKPALVTGIHPDILPLVLKKIDLTPDFFNPIVTSYDVPSELIKPNPGMLYEVLRRRIISRNETFSPNEVAVVGDSINDMLMATRAGARSIAVLTGRMTLDAATDWQAAGEPRIDRIVNDIREVPEAIESLKS